MAWPAHLHHNALRWADKLPRRKKETAYLSHKTPNKPTVCSQTRSPRVTQTLLSPDSQAASSSSGPGVGGDIKLQQPRKSPIYRNHAAAKHAAALTVTQATFSFLFACFFRPSCNSSNIRISWQVPPSGAPDSATCGDCLSFCNLKQGEQHRSTFCSETGLSGWILRFPRCRGSASAMSPGFTGISGWPNEPPDGCTDRLCGLVSGPSWEKRGEVQLHNFRSRDGGWTFWAPVKTGQRCSIVIFLERCKNKRIKLAAVHKAKLFRVV